MKKRGRPQLDIEGEEVEKHAFTGLYATEIAGLLGCDEGTIRKRFKKFFLLGKARRVHAIKKAQLETALAGNPTMLIWLGKNELGQSDTQVIAHVGPDGGPLKTETTHKFDYDQYRDMFIRQRAVARNGNGAAAPNGN